MAIYINRDKNLCELYIVVLGVDVCLSAINISKVPV